jgi:4-amino-4-deoxy-L-arabinose transferase-like glycosyltransferase
MTLLLSKPIGIINTMYAIPYSFVLTIMLSMIDRWRWKTSTFLLLFLYFLLLNSFLNIHFVVNNTAHSTRDSVGLRNLVNRQMKV